MLFDFNKYIEQQNLCRKGDRILVAVSGGIDSVVMLDLFLKSGFQLAVAHCNFQLRGKASDEDAFFVEKVGKKHALSVYVKKFKTKEYAATNKLSIQEAARDLRYEWFDKIVEQEKFDYVAIAQHLNDQVETFFINLLRGSGVKGLRGMPVQRNKIIRPLMFTDKTRIENYAKENKLFYREDESNKNDTYLRNKIRLKVLPELDKLAQNATEKIVKSMQNLNEAEIILSQLLDEKFDAIFYKKDGYITALKSDIEKLQPSELWIYYLLKGFNFNRDVTNSLSLAIIEKQSGKSFYSASHEALINRDELIIRPLQESIQRTYQIHDKQTMIAEPINLKIMTIKYSAGFEIDPSPDVAQLDKDKLHYPLLLRKWEQGDRFSPLGMKGSKLISDFLIDSKISNFEKDGIWLLVSSGEIVWVVGFRISDRFKITPETKKILTLKLC
jgi:tRNA(Ile)-lysidine synthase